jgi:hypothetical protein
LGRNEVREVTLEYGTGRDCRWQIEQFVIESCWGLWTIIEERYPKRYLFNLCKLKLVQEAVQPYRTITIYKVSEFRCLVVIMWLRHEFGEGLYGWFCQIPFIGKRGTLPHSC